MTMIKMDFQPKTKNKFIQSNTAFKLCYSWNLNISSILDSLLNKSTIRNTKINFFNNITMFTSLFLFAIIIIFVLSNNNNYFWIIKSLICNVIVNFLSRKKLQFYKFDFWLTSAWYRNINSIKKILHSNICIKIFCY